jgi:U4/U6 small nuclear ribonucleoprotein PRP3
VGQFEEERQVPKPSADGQNPYMIDWGVYPGWQPRKPRGSLNITHSMHHRPIMERENKRREAEALKAMGQGITETTVDTEEDILLRAFTVLEPPDVEWWNDDFVGQDIDTNENINDVVTVPILIEGPRKKLERKAFVLPLTSKEYKKKRRMRRAAEHEELTQKIRLGLVPTPAPKLTKQNFMRVMPDEAIKNPTYVENLVNTQIQERKDKHEEANASRKLSKEERLAKTKANADRNAKMGLKQMVFRILLGTELPYQMTTKHKFLLQKNAEQRLDLTGVCIVGPRFATLFVEGGEKSTRAYKHLILDRIKWLEILANREDVPETSTTNGEGGDANAIVLPPAGVKDTTGKLLFEGSIIKRKFKKWGGVRDATSEAQARASMEKVGVETFYNQALAGLERDIEERESRAYPKGPRRMDAFFETEEMALLTQFVGESMKPKAKVTLKGSELDAVFARDVKMLEQEVNGEQDDGEDGLNDMDE